MRKLFTLLTILIISFNLFAQTGKVVLIEELTGSWCQWCPGGAVTGEQLVHDYDDLFFVAVHCGDPMENTDYYNAYGVAGAPTAKIDRTLSELGINEWETNYLAAVAQVPDAIINVTSTYDSLTRALTVSVEAIPSVALSGDYRLGAILTEDAVTGYNSSYDQSNAYSGGGNGAMGGYENLPSPVPFYRMAYDHVGRQLLGGYNGEAGSLPATMQSGQSYTHTFNYTLPSDFDEDYIKVGALMIDQSNGQIVNAGKTDYIKGFTNAKPKFITGPTENAYEAVSYSSTIYTHDTDDSNLSVTVEGTLPSWISFTDNLDGSITLDGTPSVSGLFTVSLKISDGDWEIVNDFDITVSTGGSGTWELVGAAGFTTETLSNAEINLDNNDVPYLIYEAESGYATVMKFENGTWATVGNTGVLYDAYTNTIEFDSNNTPWILGAGGSGIAVKKWNGTAWENVGTVPTSGVQSDLVFDSSNNPYFAIQDGGSSYYGSLYTFDGTSWVKVSGSTFSSSPAVWNKLAVDSNDNIYISWCDGANYAMTPIVSKWDGSSFTTMGTNVIPDANYFYNDIVIAPDNSIYVCLCESGTHYTNVYKWNGTTWDQIGTNLFGGECEYQRITCDSNGDVYMVVQDILLTSKTSVVKYSNGSWEYVGTPGFSNSGNYQSISISSTNVPYVAFVDDANGSKATVMMYDDGSMSISEEMEMSSTSHIYPNPSTGVFNIEILNEDIQQVGVYDQLGKCIMSVDNFEASQIDLSGLENGIYYLSVKTNKAVHNSTISLVK